MKHTRPYILIALAGCMVSSAAVAQEDAPLALPAVVLPAGEPIPMQQLLDAGEAAREERAAQQAAAEASAVSSVSVVEAAIAPAAPSEDDTSFIPSYGSFPASLFFNDNQVDQMKKVLFLTERFSDDGPKEVVAKKDDELNVPLPLPVEEPEEISTPSAFPTFMVSSIIYRNAKDWVFWLNGKRVTPDNPHESMKVSRVSPRSVSFTWQPKEAASFVLHQEVLNESEPSHSLKKVMSASNNVKQVSGDQWELTLRPNQTFDTRYMAVLEGKEPKVEGGGEVKSATKAIPEVTAEDILRRAGFPSAQQSGGASQGNGRATMDDKLRDTMGQLRDSNRMLSGLKGRNNERASGFHSDSDLRSDKKASAPPAAPEPAKPSAQERIADALPKILESIGVSPSGESENNAGNEGLPLLPTQ